MRFGFEKMVAIVGPTAVGKTEAAVGVASRIGANLLSIDSQQVYTGMDIGTGKEVGQGQWITDGQWQVLQIDGVDIYGLNLTTPDKPMNVVEWRRIAWQIMAEHDRESKPLILVGGTGLYLQSLLRNSPEMNIPRNEVLRSELKDLAAEQLLARLQQLDPNRAKQLNTSDRQNPVRLIRAIEIAEYILSNQDTTQSNGDNEAMAIENLDIALIGLTMERRALYQKADRRVELMMEQGLLEEVEGLIAQYGWEQQAFRAIGYRQLIDHVAGRCTLDEAVQAIKHQTHDYIRRQYTWFHKQPVDWLEVGTADWLEDLQQKVTSLLSVD